MLECGFKFILKRARLNRRSNHHSLSRIGSGMCATSNSLKDWIVSTSRRIFIQKPPSFSPIKRVLDGQTDGEFIRRFWARCACIRKLYCDPTGFNASRGLSNTISSAGLSPSDLLAQRGLTISLKARDLGGISVGSQIVYKKSRLVKYLAISWMTMRSR